jgi:16S rRNA (guanine527-N7)-methyltransferase
LARDPAHREAYDVVTARAVARLVTLAELALPFVQRGGSALLPKGSAASEELAEARYAIGMLGGHARRLVATPFEGTTIVVLDKLKRTTEQFPRRTGVPGKTPLTAPRDFGN